MDHDENPRQIGHNEDKHEECRAHGYGASQVARHGADDDLLHHKQEHPDRLNTTEQGTDLRHLVQPEEDHVPPPVQGAARAGHR